MKIMNNQKKIKKELDYFMDIIHDGIHGEYQKGWSHRNKNEDKKALFSFVKNIIKYQK